jgi:hypothetical protein
MLSFRDQVGRSRREFLRVGALGAGGLTLPAMFAAQASAAGLADVVKDKAVVFLFMHGGPAQTELFDPKMTAPAGVHSITGERSTSLPGVTFGGTMERLAGLADRLAIVRSFRTGNGNHDIKPVVHEETAGANLGSLYARVAGTNHPRNGMPTNAVIFPQAVEPKSQPGNNSFGKFTSTGELGAAYAPFVPGAGGNLQSDMQLSLSRGRLDDRRHLLSALDRVRRTVDASGMLAGMDQFQQQAFDTLVGGVADAFDLSQEDPAVLARYDTAPLVHPDAISKAWNNYNNYVDHGQTLGKLMLLARRLCERGCGFVTVTTNFVWDMHADKNNATMAEGMHYVGLPFDHAVSAFIEDVHARGLSEKILLVCTGEIGRTPKVNKKGGRDHWGGLTPLLLSGGGLQMGQVIGQSTHDAGEPQTEPMEIRHLVSTILHTLLDISQLRIQRGAPSEIIRLATQAEPIPGLL